MCETRIKPNCINGSQQSLVVAVNLKAAVMERRPSCKVCNGSLST